MRQQEPANLTVVDHTPKLADELRTLENGGVAQGLMSITRRLKESLKWSDGNGVTAEDVAFTWQYCTYVSRCISRRSITDSRGQPPSGSHAQAITAAQQPNSYWRVQLISAVNKL